MIIGSRVSNDKDLHVGPAIVKVHIGNDGEKAVNMDGGRIISLAGRSPWMMSAALRNNERAQRQQDRQENAQQHDRTQRANVTAIIGTTVTITDYPMGLGI